MTFWTRRPDNRVRARADAHLHDQTLEVRRSSSRCYRPHNPSRIQGLTASSRSSISSASAVAGAMAADVLDGFVVRQGMADLRRARDAWVRVEYEIAKRTAAIADKQTYEPGYTKTMLDSLVELVAATAQLQDAAGRFVASGPPLSPKRRWLQFWRRGSEGTPSKPHDSIEGDAAIQT